MHYPGHRLSKFGQIEKETVRGPLTAAKLTCPCNMFRTLNSFTRSDTDVVIDSEPHLSRTCKTSLLFAPSAVAFTLAVPLFPFTVDQNILKL